MPRVNNPNAVASSLPGRMKNIARDLKDLSGASHSTIFSLVVGAGGAIINGATQLLGGVAGPLAVSGAITATSSVAAPSIVGTTSVTGSDLYTLNGPTFNITGGRVTCWLENATGRVAMATSSRRFKQDEMDVTDVDPRAILGVKVKYWHYIAEVRKRDDPTFEDYVGPGYHVALNFGPIAEDLHSAGLWMCVIYEREAVTEVRADADGNEVRVVVGEILKLDAAGNPIPFAIHDSLWSYLEHIAVQWLLGRVDDHEERLLKAGL